MTCDNCPYNGCTRVKGEGHAGSSILIVGETPFITDIENDRPFISRGGRLLRETFEFVGVPQTQCYFTYLCPCNLPEGATKSDACIDQLRQTVEHVKPKFIVVIGADAARKLLPDFNKANEDSGKIMQTIFDLPGMATIHPAVILKYKGASNFPTLTNDLTKVWRRVQGLSTRYNDPHTEAEIATSETMPAILKRINSEAQIIAYDWEATGLNPKKDEGWCLGLAWKVGHGVAIPIDLVHQFVAELIVLFSRKDIAFAAFNGMFDMKWNKAEGLPERLDHDPMLMHALFDERPQRRNLENLSMLYCDAEPYESNLLTKYNCNKSNFTTIIPPEEVAAYCCKDVDYTLRLYHVFMDMFYQEPKLLKLYRLLIIPAARTLADIQEQGFLVDVDRLTKVQTSYQQRADELLKEMHSIVGKPINPNSPKQVAAYLWDVLGLKEPDLFNRMPRSVDDSTRKALFEKYPDQPFVKALHEFKDLYTLISRYLKPIPNAMEEDGRLRTKYHLDRTDTGRIAATNFAIHTIPRNEDVRG